VERDSIATLLYNHAVFGSFRPRSGRLNLAQRFSAGYGAVFYVRVREADGRSCQYPER